MSKSTKTAARMKRLKEKRAIKAANVAKYQALTEKGINIKSKRALNKASGQAKKKMRSRNATFSNVGCLVSHPISLPGLVRMKLNSTLYGKSQFTSKYSKQVNEVIDANELYMSQYGDIYSHVTNSKITFEQLKEICR